MKRCLHNVCTLLLLLSSSVMAIASPFQIVPATLETSASLSQPVPAPEPESGGDEAQGLAFELELEIEDVLLESLSNLEHLPETFAPLPTDMLRLIRYSRRIPMPPEIPLA